MAKLVDASGLSPDVSDETCRFESDYPHHHNTRYFMAFQPPFRTGDVVIMLDYVSETDDGLAIIEKYDPISDQYSTNRAAWFDRDELQFVHDCTEESLAKLIRDLNVEDEDEDDADEEEYSDDSDDTDSGTA